MHHFFTQFSLSTKSSFMSEDLIFLTIISLPLLLFAIAFVQAIYSNVIYPLRQKSKKKNLYGYILTANEEFEHRVIVERLIKRKLRHGEEVHHINGVKWIIERVIWH